MKDAEVDPDKLAAYFDPEKFLIKLTPMNPTFNAQDNNLDTRFNGEDLTRFEQWSQDRHKPQFHCKGPIELRQHDLMPPLLS